MKKNIVYSIIFCLAIILQTSVVPVVFSRGMAADILLAFVLAGAILDGFANFFWWAIFVGFVYDLASFGVVGTHSLIFLLVVYFVSFFSRRFSVELKGIGIVWFAAFSAVATLLSRALVALAAVQGSGSAHEFPQFFGSPAAVGMQVLENVVLFFLCFTIFKD